METKERIASLETRVETEFNNIENNMGRIEDKVDTVVDNIKDLTVGLAEIKSSMKFYQKILALLATLILGGGAVSQTSLFDGKEVKAAPNVQVQQSQQR